MVFVFCFGGCLSFCFFVGFVGFGGGCLFVFLSINQTVVSLEENHLILVSLAPYSQALVFVPNSLGMSDISHGLFHDKPHACFY